MSFTNIFSFNTSAVWTEYDNSEWIIVHFERLICLWLLPWGLAVILGLNNQTLTPLRFCQRPPLSTFRDLVLPIYSWSKHGTPGSVPRLKTGLIYFPSVWLWGPDVLMRNNHQGKIEILDRNEPNAQSVKKTLNSMFIFVFFIRIRCILYLNTRKKTSKWVILNSFGAMCHYL